MDETITQSYMIRPEQRTLLQRFARETDRSVSAALRFIIDDWVNLKRTALEAAKPTISQQEQPA